MILGWHGKRISKSEAVSKSQDPVLVDYLMQFFHNIAAWIILDRELGCWRIEKFLAD